MRNRQNSQPVRLEREVGGCGNSWCYRGNYVFLVTLVVLSALVTVASTRFDLTQYCGLSNRRGAGKRHQPRTVSQFVIKNIPPALFKRVGSTDHEVLPTTLVNG